MEGKPIVVQSNNDGCVVARSNETKAMGITEGTPYFQLTKLFFAEQSGKAESPNAKIAVFSSNYELYGELTGRVVSIISKETSAYFHYFEWCPIEDVWGIGRRYAAKLQSLGCKTAPDFARHHKDWVRQTFNNINIVRTWQELNGEDAVPNEECLS